LPGCRRRRGRRWTRPQVRWLWGRIR
jgi:hypothetical protein